jgi:Holliday junction resolvasome RuvABC DNA-binding subunit
VEGETALFSVREPRVVEYLASRGIDINHINRKKQSVIEADVKKIIDAMRYDEDRQDEFIPKFRTLIKLGIDRTHVKNAFKMAESAKMYDLKKVIACLKPYAR